jgi:DNA primase
MDMRVVILPSGKDPDEAARENPGLLKKAITDAIPVYDYFLTSAQKRYDVTTSYGKKKISEEIAPVLSKIENPIVQNHYIHKTAQVLQTTEDAVEENMRRIVRQSDPKHYKPVVETPRPESGLSREERLEVYLMAFLFQGRTIELFEDLQDSGLLPEFTNPAAHRIIDRLMEFLFVPEGEPVGARVFLIKDFADSLPAELMPTFDEAFLWDLSEILDSEDRFSKEWTKILREFNKMTLHRKIQRLTKLGSQDDVPLAERSDIQKQLSTLTIALKDLENSG